MKTTVDKNGHDCIICPFLDENFTNICNKWTCALKNKIIFISNTQFNKNIIKTPHWCPDLTFQPDYS